MLAASPGERLRTLRDLLGVTQVALADLGGISQAWISDVEKGKLDPLPAKLDAIAQATGTPVGFFYVQCKTLPLDSLRFRKLASASRITERRIHAFYGESYRVCETLLEDEKYPTPPLPFASKAELDQDDIDQAAEETRAALRLAPSRPIPHLTRALERGGVPVAPLVFDELGEGDASGTQGHFGVSYWAGIGDRALIGYFPGSDGARDRFTLAHEVGHLVLHTYRPNVPNAEEEANKFAAALLLPKDRVVDSVSESLTLGDYARLKATWGMSIQAIVMRGYAVGVIGDTRKRSLFVQLSAKGWRRAEPVNVGTEEPGLLWTLLSRRFGPRPYIPAAEKFSIHPTVLRSIAPSHAPKGQSLRPITKLGDRR